MVSRYIIEFNEDQVRIILSVIRDLKEHGYCNHIATNGVEIMEPLHERLDSIREHLGIY